MYTLLIIIAKAEIKKTELNHKIERAYDIKLNPFTEVKTFKIHLNKAKEQINKYWLVLLVLFLSYMIYFNIAYVRGLNSKLTKLERTIEAFTKSQRANIDN